MWNWISDNSSLMKSWRNIIGQAWDSSSESNEMNWQVSLPAGCCLLEAVAKGCSWRGGGRGEGSRGSDSLQGVIERHYEAPLLSAVPETLRTDKSWYLLCEQWAFEWTLPLWMSSVLLWHSTCAGLSRSWKGWRSLWSCCSPQSSDISGPVWWVASHCWCHWAWSETQKGATDLRLLLSISGSWNYIRY